MVFKLANSCALFPIYNSMVDLEEDSGPHLVDITQRSCWVVYTGVLTIHNRAEATLAPGFTPLYIDLAPRLVFAEHFQQWWDAQDTYKVLKTLEDVEIAITVLIKDKDFKFDRNSYEISELGWKLRVKRAHLSVNPVTYVHLINITDVFSRPLAKSGDREKMKIDERKYIFQNVRKIDFVRKKGSTLKYWYDYVAVFSGSYIYFYPASDSGMIQNILRSYEQNDTLIKGGPKFGDRARANT